ncbi:hypothetical protein DFJ73DRAFT_147380 [Zopfochytrium polystomum]|nr:hypothetical protein DFJ73DRAFT_147380 [Zopfochytrium polystomum]
MVRFDPSGLGNVVGLPADLTSSASASQPHAAGGANRDPSVHPSTSAASNALKSAILSASARQLFAQGFVPAAKFSAANTTVAQACFTIDGTTATMQDFVGYSILRSTFNDTASLDAYLLARMDASFFYVTAFQQEFGCAGFTGSGERYHQTYYQALLLALSQNQPDGDVSCPAPTTVPNKLPCRSTIFLAIDALNALFANPTICPSTDAASLNARAATLMGYKILASLMPGGENAPVTGPKAGTLDCFTTVKIESTQCGYPMYTDALTYCAMAGGTGAGIITPNPNDPCCKALAPFTLPPTITASPPFTNPGTATGTATATGATSGGSSGSNSVTSGASTGTVTSGTAMTGTGVSSNSGNPGSTSGMNTGTATGTNTNPNQTNQSMLPTETNNPGTNNGLSTPTLIGIIVSAITAALIIAAVIFFCCFRKRRQKDSQNSTAYAALGSTAAAGAGAGAAAYGRNDEGSDRSLQSAGVSSTNSSQRMDAVGVQFSAPEPPRSSPPNVGGYNAGQLNSARSATPSGADGFGGQAFSSMPPSEIYAAAAVATGAAIVAGGAAAAGGKDQHESYLTTETGVSSTGVGRQSTVQTSSSVEIDEDGRVRRKSSLVSAGDKSDVGSLKMRAVFDYDAAMTDELSFRVGQIITVTALFDDGWGHGMIDGQRGAFPLSCVVPVDGDSRAGSGNGS